MQHTSKLFWWGGVSMTTCPIHHISIGEAGCALCSRKVKKPKFGEKRSPLKQSGQKATRMSAEAQVQADLALAARCLLLGFLPGDCSEKPQRCHIVPQALIRDTYPKGAWRPIGDEFWRRVDRHTDLDIDGIEYVTLQQILDDNSNFVNGCSNHNVDGQAMVDALDARKVAGVPSYPAGFGEFTHSFRFNCEGYWYYVKFEDARRVA